MFQAEKAYARVLGWEVVWHIKDPQIVVYAQLCPTLCDPLDCSLPGSSVHGILQARITRVDCYFLILPSPALGLLAVSFDLTPIKK